MRFWRIFVLVAAIAVLSGSAFAEPGFYFKPAKAVSEYCVEKKTGVKFEFVVKNESENICVGTGLRTHQVLFVDIPIYAAAFYLDEKSIAELKTYKGGKIEEMVKGRYARIIRMKFVKDVPARKIRERFLEGLRYSMPNPSQKTTEHLDAFLDTLKDVKKGEEMEIYFGYYVAGELKPDLVATKKIVVENKELSVGLLNLWFDDKPAIPELKKEVLKNLGGE